MTDTNDTTAPVATPAPEASATPPELVAAPADGAEVFPRDYVEQLRHESAGYRTRAKDAETERDGLLGRIDALERGELERRAAASGLRPEAVEDLRAATNLGDLRGDDGQLDVGKVDAAVAEVKQARPHWFASPGEGYAPVPHGTQPPPERRPTFGDALKRTVGGSR